MARLLAVGALCGWALSPHVVHAKEGRKGWGAYQCDPARSELTVWVSKRGMLSAAGHNLVLKAREWESKLTLTPEGDARLLVVVDAASLEVANTWTPSPKGPSVGIDGAPVSLGTMDRWSIGQIHGSMRGKDVLDVAKFPSVIYEGVARRDAPGLTFEGHLTLKGATQPLALRSTLTPEEPAPQAHKGPLRFLLKGETTFLQSRWGIPPYSVFLGSLQLKDEITVKWEVAYAMQED